MDNVVDKKAIVELARNHVEQVACDGKFQLVLVGMGEGASWQVRERFGALQWVPTFSSPSLGEACARYDELVGNKRWPVASHLDPIFDHVNRAVVVLAGAGRIRLVRRGLMEGRGRYEIQFHDPGLYDWEVETNTLDLDDAIRRYAIR